MDNTVGQTFLFPCGLNLTTITAPIYNYTWHPSICGVRLYVCLSTILDYSMNIWTTPENEFIRQKFIINYQF